MNKIAFITPNLILLGSFLLLMLFYIYIKFLIIEIKSLISKYSKIKSELPNIQKHISQIVSYDFSKIEPFSKDQKEVVTKFCDSYLYIHNYFKPIADMPKGLIGYTFLLECARLYARLVGTEIPHTSLQLRHFTRAIVEIPGTIAKNSIFRETPLCIISRDDQKTYISKLFQNVEKFSEYFFIRLPRAYEFYILFRDIIMDLTLAYDLNKRIFAFYKIQSNPENIEFHINYFRGAIKDKQFIFTKIFRETLTYLIEYTPWTKYISSEKFMDPDACIFLQLMTYARERLRHRPDFLSKKTEKKANQLLWKSFMNNLIPAYENVLKIRNQKIDTSEKIYEELSRAYEGFLRQVDFSWGYPTSFPWAELRRLYNRYIRYELNALKRKKILSLKRKRYELSKSAKYKELVNTIFKREGIDYKSISELALGVKTDIEISVDQFPEAAGFWDPFSITRHGDLHSLCALIYSSRLLFDFNNIDRIIAIVGGGMFFGGILSIVENIPLTTVTTSPRFLCRPSIVYKDRTLVVDNTFKTGYTSSLIFSNLINKSIYCYPQIEGLLTIGKDFSYVNSDKTFMRYSNNKKVSSLCEYSIEHLETTTKEDDIATKVKLSVTKKFDKTENIDENKLKEIAGLLATYCDNNNLIDINRLKKLVKHQCFSWRICRNVSPLKTFDILRYNPIFKPNKVLLHYRLLSNHYLVWEIAKYWYKEIKKFEIDAIIIGSRNAITIGLCIWILSLLDLERRKKLLLFYPKKNDGIIPGIENDMPDNCNIAYIDISIRGGTNFSFIECSIDNYFMQRYGKNKKFDKVFAVFVKEEIIKMNEINDRLIKICIF